NPFNPFGVPVGIGYRFTGFDSEYNPRATFFRALAGTKGSLAGNWSWDLSAQRSQDDTDLTYRNYNFDTIAVRNALSSSDPATALNPFVTGPPASSALLDTLFIDRFSKYKGRKDTFAGLIRGPLLTMPAGDIQLAVGAEYAHDQLSTSGDL